jgi:aspartyl-tRNA(Asn)/glutamyl-tRNA(Gln) amidotransferase subunit C
MCRSFPKAFHSGALDAEAKTRCARIHDHAIRWQQRSFPLKISREDVLRVAELAYLDLSEAELETYRAQIDEILEYIGKLNELDTAKVEPMAQVLSDDQTADATLREDLIVPCTVAEDVLKHAPDPEPPYFRVPKVIERT